MAKCSTLAHPHASWLAGYHTYPRTRRPSAAVSTHTRLESGLYAALATPSSPRGTSFVGRGLVGAGSATQPGDAHHAALSPSRCRKAPKHYVCCTVARNASSTEPQATRRVRVLRSIGWAGQSMPQARAPRPPRRGLRRQRRWAGLARRWAPARPQPAAATPPRPARLPRSPSPPAAAVPPAAPPPAGPAPAAPPPRSARPR